MQRWSRQIGRYFSRATLLLVGLSLLGMGCSAPRQISLEEFEAREQKIFEKYPEKIIYRIDEHRYLTIKGERGLAGLVFYHDIVLGLRTYVGKTQSDGANQLYQGHFVIDSDNIVIPLLRMPNAGGRNVHIHYSTDKGKTFKWFSRGGGGGANDVIILKNNFLYTARCCEDTGRIFYVSKYDITKELSLAANRTIRSTDLSEMNSTEVPLNFRSPSGSTRFLSYGRFVAQF